jgi:hypothetical protein
MGVYYYFLNRTTNQLNKNTINGSCTFIAKLDSMDNHEIITFFERVRKK